MLYKYCDEMEPGARRPRLWLARGAKAVKFTGQDISDICLVLTATSNKKGKSSGHTYELELFPGVRPLYFLSPLNRTWGDHFASWGELANHLGLPVEVAQKIVKIEFWTSADRLDKIDNFTEAAKASGKDAEAVIISFGNPTKRAMRKGFWMESKFGRTSDGQEVRIGLGSNGWSDPVVLFPDGAKIIRSSHIPGPNGGYYTVEVMVPINKVNNGGHR